MIPGAAGRDRHQGKLEFESRQQIGDLEPVRTENYQLNYQKADAVQKLLTDPNQRMLSKRGSAVGDTRTNMLFVKIRLRGWRMCAD